MMNAVFFKSLHLVSVNQNLYLCKIYKICL